MDVLKLSSAPLNFTANLNKSQFPKQCMQIHLFPSSSSSSIINSHSHSRRFKLCASISSTISTEESANPFEVEPESERREERFDWYAQWYPIMPICDLDKRVPLGKTVMGIDVVVWWDKNENAWKVFEDLCPHRLAPLSEGRIDQWGRLQCVYHGWCFNGSGDCKFIPQAPPDGPPIHTSKRACVAVYPSILQNDVLWFWPNSDPQYKDISVKKKPPYIPELDDPSYTKTLSNRDLPYGYEVLTENLMDPAHVPYAHYGIMGRQQPNNREKADREGGKPLEIAVRDFDVNGFITNQELGNSQFFAPCVFYTSFILRSKERNPKHQDNETLSSAENNNTVAPNTSQRKAMLIFMCIPVSPGKSRVIFVSLRNFAVWIDRFIPRWIFHVGQNLIFDSDLYLLHVEERKLLEVGPSNWQKACFVPTKSDAKVVAFRRWLNNYSDGQIDWRGKFSGILPPSPSKEQLMDRYWSHVVNCSSCRVAYKGLNALEVVLQVISIASLGVFAATTKQSLVTGPARIVMVAMAILCFVASKWLSHFIYKNFHFHDYNHALI